MKEYVFAPQSDSVEEYARAHVVPLYPQQLLGILIEIRIVPQLLRNSIINLVYFVVSQPHLGLDVIAVDRVL